jgi:hypothetical protein
MHTPHQQLWAVDDQVVPAATLTSLGCGPPPRQLGPSQSHPRDSTPPPVVIHPVHNPRCTATGTGTNTQGSTATGTETEPKKLTQNKSTQTEIGQER